MRVPWDVIVDLFKGGVSKRFAFLAMVLGAVLLIGIGVAFLVWPGIAVDDTGLTVNDRLQRENDARGTALQALAGIVLAVGGAFTAYSVLSTREGQLDERFARSLELMSSKDVQVVSGAVFSLERIAAQSRFDRPAVIDVLSGFVRAGASLDSDGKEAPRSEVMDALRVIGRLNGLWRSPRPDLRGTCWKEAQLVSLDLSRSLLAESVFEGAILHETRFREANLLRANLADAMLFDADLSKAYLRGADLSRAALIGASLAAATLVAANLTDANLTGAKLDDAVFMGASLHGASLVSPSLHRADLEGAKYTESTHFPRDFVPEEHGMVLVEAPSATGDGPRASE